MDSEFLFKFIGDFPDYLAPLSRTLLRFVLDNLCRNSCIYLGEERPAIHVEQTTLARGRTRRQRLGL